MGPVNRDSARFSEGWGSAMKAPSARQLLLTFVPAISILLITGGVGVLFRVNMANLTRDVTAIANIHPLSGFLSNLSILLWCAAASICAFAAMILTTTKPRELFWFLLSSALLSAYILFDDLFMFHEALAPKYLGLSEKVIYAGLGIAVFAYLVAFRRAILRTNFSMLLLALAFLGTSVFVDAVAERWLGRLGDWEYFLEDGIKWMGIACWCSYYVHTSYQLLASTFRRPHDIIRSDPGTGWGSGAGQIEEANTSHDGPLEPVERLRHYGGDVAVLRYDSASLEVGGQIPGRAQLQSQVMQGNSLS